MSLKKKESKESIAKLRKVIESNKKIILNEEVKKLNNSNEISEIKPQIQSPKAIFSS